MPNGKSPQTDREWLIQIDSKLSSGLKNIEILFKKDHGKEERLKALEIQNNEVEHIKDVIEKQPSVIKYVVWTGIIMGLFTGAVNAAFAMFGGTP